MTNIPHKPIEELDLDDLHEKIRIYAHNPIGHAKTGELGNNYLMDKKSTDILSSSIADYAIAEVRKWLAAQPQPLNDGEPSRIADQILRDLYERHDVLAKGWHEPVYGKKMHIGDRCPTCNTNFAGLRDDIRLLVGHYFAAHSPSTEANTFDNHLRKYLPDDGKYRHVEFDIAIHPGGGLDFKPRNKKAALESVTTDEGGV